MNSATPRVRKTVYLIWLLLLFVTSINAATINSQPVNSSVCVNSNMAFVVVASGATAYQWEVNTGSSWSNVSNAGVYSGATTATLAITGATISLNTYQYRCVVTGTPNVTSNAVTLTVVALPTITGTTNGAVCAGNTGQVSATASSGASVKWYNASTAGTLLGTGSTLSIPSAASTATYYAEAFTGGGSGTLATAYNNDNGQRGVMFDVIPTSNITVTGFDGNLYSGTTAEYQVYYKVGSFVGSVLTPGDWTPLDTVTALTSLGTNVPTPMGFNISVPLMANQTYAFYITNTYGGGTSYTVGAAPGELLATNADLSMYGGVGVSFPFLTAFNYRRFNGTIHYTGSGCPSVSRSGATLTVNPNANITAQPSNSSITSGGNTSFSITATSATGYQWQVNSGSGWGNVTNGGIYSSAATGTLSLTNATATVNGNQYRCIATGAGGCNDTSNVATLSITGTPPSISSQPSNSIVCSGASTSFSVTASGTGLSYQWQVNSGSGWTNITNGGIYLGALTATLNIAPASQTQNSNQYRCVVTGSVAPPATSNAALLTVNGSPVVSSQPPNRIICSGQNTTFVVTASYATGYQWQVNSGSGWSNVSNGGIYSGASTATLTLTGATASVDGNQYRCIVSGSCPPNAISNAGTLTINTAPSISAQPPNRSICSGLNTTFTVTASNATGYQWQVNSGSGWGNVSNGGIYSGAATATLTLTGATASVDGNQYRCVVNGSCTPNATSNTATITINSAPAITAQPSNSTIGAGSNTSFSVTATNATGYQWQVNSGSGWGNVTNGGVYSGATTATLTLTAAGASLNANQYRCIASGGCTPNATSNAATLTVNSAPAITGQPSNSIICSGSNTTFSITASNATGYQWQVNSGSGWSNVTNTGIYTGATTSILTLAGATAAVDGNQYRCEVTGATTPNAISNAATLTVNIAPSISAQPGNSAICSGLNTTFNVTANNATGYQWQVNSGSGWGNVTNTGIYSGATTATLTLTGAATGVDGNQYRCVAMGNCPPNATSNAATLTINSAPSFTAQPTNSTICDGANTTFTVAANDATGYQWQVNSGSGWNNVTNTGIYTGASTATLTLTGATVAADGNQYRCTISGGCAPNATSNARTLTINSAPAITAHLVNSTICSGNNTSFSITANNATGYQWQVNSGSGWGNVTNGGIYSGVATASLTLTAATTSVDGYQYRCVVTGSCTPNATSNTATITINSAPAITVQPSNSTIGAGSNTAFSVTANNAIGYQWQVNSGSGWSNVTNAGVYSGATTATLTLTAAGASLDGNQYRCIVTGGCSPNATSNAATLTVNSAPAITGQPSGSAICNNTNTSFSVIAINATTYQWQVNSGSGWNNISDGGIYSGATTATLSLTGATAALDGYQYRCEVTGLTTPNAISNVATLSINLAPAITTHPSNSIICNNSNTTFTIAATDATGYQWQVNSGSGWGNVSNGGIYTGATTSPLILTAATATVNGYQYRCVASGGCSPAVTSNAATITINAAPSVTAQPSNSIICDGANTSFSVTATGIGLGYQWQVNDGSGWANVSNSGIYTGVATSTLTLTAATTVVNSYQYRCVVNGSCNPSATSNAATLTINVAPAVTIDPSNSIVCDGGNTSFTVTATGTGLSYQWQVNSGSGWSNVSNGGIYSGVAANTLALTAATAAQNSYQYRCVVSGSCAPSATSNAATLSINSILTINTQPANSIICAGNNAMFNVVASASGLGYQWQENSGSGWANVSNGGIYSGATTATLTLTAATTAVNGNQYRCELSSSCTAPTNSNAAALTVNVAPAITAQPTNSTICLGSNTSFTITASGSGITYQWEVNSGSGWANVSNGGIYTGAATNTLNLTSPTTTVDGYQYRCIVGGSCVPGVISSAVTLAVNTAPAITSQPSNSIICSGNNTSFAITATGTNISYQWQVNSGSGWNNVSNGGIYTGATTNTLDLTTPTTSVTGYQYRCAVNGVCPPNVTSSVATITVNVAPAITAQPTNSTICLGGNTSFAITASGSGITYQWEVNNGSSWTNVANAGIYTGATTNTLSLTSPTTSVDGYQYRCIIGGSCVPGVTSSAVTLAVNTAPAITSQPSNSIICSGSNTSFTITATGTNISYQWQVNSGAGWANISNGGIYTGATTNTLDLTTPTTAINGYQYRCIVNGVCPPNVTSSVATITVNAAPSITLQPSNSTICSGSNTSFAIAATGTNLTYQWEVNDGSGWSNISNSGIYTGATTNTLNLTAPTIALSTYQYRCVIGGTCVPGVTSSAVTLMVNSLPAITLQPSNSTICSGDNTSFNIAATGTNITYQWQVNSGSGWANISNGGIYTGAATNMLNLIAVTTAHTSYQYRCIVIGTCTPAVTSGIATLTINTAPAINTQPSNKVICEGSNTTFTVVAVGTGLAHQWQVNDGSGWNNVNNTGIYTGATTATLSLVAATTIVDGYQYRCVIGGTCVPGITSSVAALTINTAPVITLQPAPATICSGNNTSFTVAATGTALTYQWQANSGSGWGNIINGGIYTGATAAILNLTGATTSVGGYQYRCVVSGTCAPAATSSPATLIINALPAIVSQPSASTICENTNTSFAVTATGTGVTYQWQVNAGSGWSSITNAGIYTGATTATLNLASATVAIHNYQYRCVVGGTCTPAVTSSPAILSIQTAPIITTQPVNATKCEGLSHGFAVVAAGTGLTYQWEVNTGAGWASLPNGGVYSGVTTNTLALTSIPAAYNNYQYRCQVNGTCMPGVTSAIARLIVNTNPVVTTQPAASIVICSNDNATIQLQAIGTGLTYQWQVDAGLGWAFISNGGVYSGVSTNTLVLTNVSSAYNNYEYRCIITGTCAAINSAVSMLTVQSKPAITVNPANKAVCEGTNNVLFTMDAIGTALTYQWQVDKGTGWANLANNATYTGVATKQLQIGQTAYSMDGYQYRCVASGVCPPDATTSVALFTVYPLKVPVVSITASDTDICVGTSVTFSSVIVNGGSSPAYKWKVNGNVLGTGSNYTSTMFANNDVVVCELTSSYVCPTPPVVTSNSISMEVTPYSTPAITITSPTNGEGCEGLPVYFYSQITNGGNTPAYTWRVNGNPAGANIDTFASVLQNDDLITCILTSSLKCPLPPSVTSNTIKADILKITKSMIGIFASPDEVICEDESIIMYSSFTNGGTKPQYQWIKNGVNIPGETQATMKPTGLNDKDIITCRFISSARCVFPELSNDIVFDVEPSETPEVGVTVSHIGNQQVMFKAIPKHEGATPSYQWFRNGKVISGAENPEYITSDKDMYAKISVRLVSSLECVTSKIAMSRNITTNIEPQMEVLSDINLYPNPNAGSFNVEAVCANSVTGVAELNVMNAVGQLVYKEEVNVVNGKITHTIHMNNEPAAGTYMLWIVTEGYREPKMFTITK